MIELTRLNGTQIILNSDLIKTAEAAPDTMLTLINGEKMIVRETPEQVVERVMDYRARLIAGVVNHLPAASAIERVAALSSLVASDPGANAPERRKDSPGDAAPAEFGGLPSSEE